MHHNQDGIPLVLHNRCFGAKSTMSHGLCTAGKIAKSSLVAAILIEFALDHVQDFLLVHVMSFPAAKPLCI
jgi:hypothetical protein